MNLIRKLSIITMMFATVTAYANPVQINNRFLCPSLESVQQRAAYIDSTEQDNSGFFAYTSQNFTENNTSWLVATIVMGANSQEKAIGLARTIVTNINVRKSEIADVINESMFICYYEPGYVIAVGGNRPNLKLIKK